VLLDEEAEERLDVTVEAAMAVMAATFIARALRGRVPPGAAVSLNQFGERSFLEKSFFAGKVAGELGPDALRNMSESDLDEFINNLEVTPSDAVKIEQLKTDTQRWLQGRADAWKQRNRELVVVADRKWTGTLQAVPFQTSAARQVARASAIDGLVRGLAGAAESVNPDMERLFQTDINQYFQQGQAATMNIDEVVFKIPRLSAEKQCMRLHVGSDGTPIRYRLRDVQGNSNVGRKPNNWVFTIGPVHPHCFCILHRETQKKAGADKKRKEARAEAFKGFAPSSRKKATGQQRTQQKKQPPLTKSLEHESCEDDEFPIHLKELFQDELQKSLRSIRNTKLFDAGLSKSRHL